MALTNIDYNARVRDTQLNVYFVSEGDGEYNIRTQSIVPANPCCNCYSVAKAFTVTALGILYDRGALTPQTRICDILGDLIPENADPKWQKVTLHDLMLHRAGYGRSGLLDIDAQNAAEYGSTDYINLAFSAPLPYEPGTVHTYTDAAYYILSRVVERLSGTDLAAFMRPALMEVMGFKELAWSVCPRGYSMGATGLYLRTEDTVKLGILYLNRGVWKDIRIISQEWVDTVLKNGYEFKDKGNGWFGKGGMRGQMLAFNPARNLAVAWHSYEDNLPFNAIIQE